MFKEVQRISMIWLYLLIGGLDLLFIYAFISQLFLGQSFGENPMDNAGMIFLFTLMAAITWLLFSAKLIV